MKVVFPCKGVIILNKKDVETLKTFYETKLKTSKVYEMYHSSEYMMQIGNFNYLPEKSTIVLDETKLLTTSKLRAILNGNTPKQETSTTKTTDSENSALLDDNTILSHPFFQTLKPLD